MRWTPNSQTTSILIPDPKHAIQAGTDEIFSPNNHCPDPMLVSFKNSRAVSMAVPTSNSLVVRSAPKQILPHRETSHDVPVTFQRSQAFSCLPLPDVII